MAGFRNMLFMPNLEDFLNSLLTVYHDSESAIHSEDGNMAEFYCRRLEEYHRTVAVMYNRISQYRRVSSSSTAQLVCDIGLLMNIIAQRIEQLGGLYHDEGLWHNDTEASLALGTTCFGGVMGRPRVQISQEQVQILRTNLGFKWVDIAQMFGVCPRTLSRRRLEFGMLLGHEHNFSSMTDCDLDNLVKEILLTTPQSGVGLIQGSLRSRGIRIQRRRIISCLWRLDPVTSALRQSRAIVRRTYNVPGPNSLWHIDGDHKLISPYRFVIHGGIDGFSRLIVYLHASTSNRSGTVFQYFREATTKYNIPSRVRSDMGLENIDVGRFMLQTRGCNRGSIITGNSVHNQRIERLWREVNRIIVSRFINIFLFLEHTGNFNPNNEFHLYCLHLVYLPLINKALDELMAQWNNHPLSTEENLSPRQIWTQGMLQLRHSNLTAVQDVFLNNSINIEDFGIDEDGPVPALHPDIVTVPQSTIELSFEEHQIICHAVHSIPPDENGITAFIAALHAIDRINIG